MCQAQRFLLNMASFFCRFCCRGNYLRRFTHLVVVQASVNSAGDNHHLRQGVPRGLPDFCHGFGESEERRNLRGGRLERRLEAAAAGGGFMELSTGEGIRFYRVWGAPTFV